MNINSPHRLIRAFCRQPVDKTPVWLMRQAGRYLPEYRELRQKVGGFLAMAKNPEIACEITLQPLKRFPLDGAIIFSDILTIPDAMGLELYFVENEGPKFKNIINHQKDVDKIIIPDPNEKLKYVMDAIKLTQKELNHKTPLIGFAGSPWTVATYIVEDAKKMLYQNPELLHNLLEKLTQSTILYLNAQIDAGVDAIMLFDTWGGLLSTKDYKNISLSYAQKIFAGLNRQQKDKKIPCIFFTKFGGQWLEEMVSTSCDAIGLDWTIDINTARERVGESVALQGNMDPMMLYTNPEKIHAEVEFILKSYGKNTGHVFNLGHGVPKDVPVENVAALVEAVHTVSEKYHVSN
ncbi:MAG TPA: uroporphyrinogen decarboxylase [Gammaproteobacteria bacterium]|nr:uroporphyrinogen decarboxylase [Gammaproteobacteria bacterium]